MVVYLPRSAWGARAPRSGPGALLASRVRGVAIHWPGTGSTRPIHSQASVASALRGWQAFHMDSRGWSDIAYQVAVDQAGRAWVLRGLRMQSGANGNLTLNQQFGAILLVLVTGEQPSSAMKATVRGVVADFRRSFPRGTRIVAHSAIRPGGTDCPGPAARAAIARGDFTPRSSSETPMTPAQMTELKNFIEARNKAYALWVHKALTRQIDVSNQAYTLWLHRQLSRQIAQVTQSTPNTPVDPDPEIPTEDPIPFPDLPPEDETPAPPEDGTPDEPGTPEEPDDLSEPPNPDPVPEPADPQK